VYKENPEFGELDVRDIYNSITVARRESTELLGGRRIACDRVIHKSYSGLAVLANRPTCRYLYAQRTCFFRPSVQLTLITRGLWRVASAGGGESRIASTVQRSCSITSIIKY